MSHFLQYFFDDVGRIFKAFIGIFASFFEFMNYLFNFPMRFQLIQKYAPDFTVGEWVLIVITEIVLLAIAGLLVFLIFKLLRKLLRFRVPVKKYDELARQVKSLQRDLILANYEKDRLLQMRAAELGGMPEEPEEEKPEETEDQYIPNENRNRFDSPCVDPETSRFFRLTTVDNFYKTEYVKPVYDDSITLTEFCEKFRN